MQNAVFYTLMLTMFLLTERILNQAWGPSVSLHILAWAWGALSRHWFARLYTKGESLYASWRRACGGPLQVAFSHAPFSFIQASNH